MASPQLENGYTKIANELLEALYRQNLSGQEFRMILLIIRKTYGFNKIDDKISLNQMIEEIKLSKIRCSQIINKLQLQKIVTVTENCNGLFKKYKLNKDFQEWPTVTEKCNGYRKMKQRLQKNETELKKKSVSKEKEIQKTSSKERRIVPWSSFFEIWNSNCDELLSPIRELTDERKTKIKARLLKNQNFLSDFAETINEIKKTPFLCGENDRKWRADFDWVIVNNTNYIKVLEGKYGKKNIKTEKERAHEEHETYMKKFRGKREN
jgi:phage replication O-like protein O